MSHVQQVCSCSDPGGAHCASRGCSIIKLQFRCLTLHNNTSPTLHIQQLLPPIFSNKSSNFQCFHDCFFTFMDKSLQTYQLISKFLLWFGARWFGFLGDFPYENNIFLWENEAMIKSHTTWAPIHLKLQASGSQRLAAKFSATSA